MLNALPEGLVGGIGLPVESPQTLRVWMIPVPFAESAQAQEVAVVAQKLFQTGTRDVR